MFHFSTHCCKFKAVKYFIAEALYLHYKYDYNVGLHLARYKCE